MTAFQARISYDLFLNANQQTTLIQLPNSNLKACITESYLDSAEILEIEIARLALDILAKCLHRTFEATTHQFLLVILRDTSDGAQTVLEKVSKICQKKGEEVFFSFAASKRKEYYLLYEVRDIATSFFNVIRDSEEIPFIKNFPRYEEGGKAFLSQLLQTEVKNLDVTVEKQKELFIQLMKAEWPLRILKERAVEYLNSLAAEQRSPLTTYKSFFNHLINRPSSLKENEKGELIKLIVAATTNPEQNILNKYQKADLNKLLDRVVALCKSGGEETWLVFRRSPSLQVPVSLEDVEHALFLIEKQAADSEQFAENFLRLKELYSGKIDLKNLIISLEDKLGQKTAFLVTQPEDIATLVKRFKGQDSLVKFPLSSAKVDQLEAQYMIVHKWCIEWKDLRLQDLVHLACDLSNASRGKKWETENLLKLIAIGRLAIRIKFTIYPHPVQIFALLALLDANKGIGQIKTGQGKSTINALLCLSLSMQRRKVHGISSDKGLSIRDQRKYNDFFNRFGKTISHICDPNPPSERFKADIIFGTASDFEFAIMRELLNGEQLFDGVFDAVIVDEVDNLTVDTASNSSRLSFSVPSSNGWVYPTILAFMKEKFRGDEELEVNEEHVLALRNFLETYKGEKFKEQSKKLTNEKLSTWIESAFRALFKFKLEDEYVIQEEMDEDGTPSKNIVIADCENTGRMKIGSRWQSGVHEFLEAKHLIDVKKESLTPISISHAVYYEMYKSFFGMTGTLGTDEREEIASVYQVSLFDVPTHQPSRRIDYPTIIVPTQKIKMEKILERVKQMRGRCARVSEGRPTLLFRKTINLAKTTGDFLLQNGIPSQSYTGTEKLEDEEILDKVGVPGQVTIATNIAARGADPILKGDSLNNGGLHALIGDYPATERDEEQNRGRAGRQGQPGSSEMILSAEEFNMPWIGDSVIFLKFLNEQRRVKTRMLGMVHTYFARLERHSFTFVKRFYTGLNKFSDLTVKNDVFLMEKSNHLGTRKYKKEKPNLEHLESKDRKIADEAFSLLINEGVDEIRWKNLLIQIGKRMREQAIAEWATEYVEKTEKHLHDSNFSRVALEIERVRIEQNRPVGIIEQGRGAELEEIKFWLESSAEIECERIKNTFEVIYKGLNQKWEAKLTQDGIIDYLRSITGLTLPFI